MPFEHEAKELEVIPGGGMALILSPIARRQPILVWKTSRTPTGVLRPLPLAPPRLLPAVERALPDPEQGRERGLLSPPRAHARSTRSCNSAVQARAMAPIRHTTA